MAPTRSARPAARKTPAGRRKSAAKPRAKAKSKLKAKLSRRRAAVKARAGKARAAVKRRVRTLGAGVKAARAVVRALRSPGPASNGLADAANEEQRIESAKYLPRHAPKRLFETERFVFPDSYGVNRVRLLVKDPEWIFAHWDVDPGVMTSLRTDLGERALALSRLTLRLSDTVEGGSTVILLPKAARNFYIRADGAARSYQAELGLTLPSGEFRALASSNTVRTPRVGRSPDVASARVRFDRAGSHVPQAALAFGARRARPGRMADTRVMPEGSPPPSPRAGGASDTYRR